jgi:thiol-disulfide isomerase/thioredoxin
MSKLKVIFYSAPWCDGCSKMRPKFFETCKELGVSFEVVDVEEEVGVQRSIKNCVRNVPTLIFIKNGREVGRAKGNQSYLEIAKYV